MPCSYQEKLVHLSSLLVVQFPRFKSDVTPEINLQDLLCFYCFGTIKKIILNVRAPAP